MSSHCCNVLPAHGSQGPWLNPLKLWARVSLPSLFLQDILSQLPKSNYGIREAALQAEVYVKLITWDGLLKGRMGNGISFPVSPRAHAVLGRCQGQGSHCCRWVILSDGQRAQTRWPGTPTHCFRLSVAFMELQACLVLPFVPHIGVEGLSTRHTVLQALKLVPFSGRKTRPSTSWRVLPTL